MMFSESPLRRGIPVLGYTTRRHLLLDLDDTSQYRARAIAEKIMREWPKVGDCLLLSSSLGNGVTALRYSRYGRPLVTQSRDNFHLVFDNGIGYNLCIRICEVLAHLRILERDYVRIREFRGDMTLRVGPSILYNEFKQIPLVLGRLYNFLTLRRDGYIERYLKVKKGVEALFWLKPVQGLTHSD